jgi:hypothetical protein
MSDDPKLDVAMKRLAAENNAIISSIGEVTRVWATLEMGLFQLFSVLTGLSGDKAWDECAGVIFYTPSNTETRVALVDNLVAYRCELQKFPTPADEIDGRLSALWNNIKGKIDRLKNTRNAIVHGTVGSGGTADKSFVKLMPAFGDTLRFYGAVTAQRNIPGLGSNEINVHSKAVWRVNDRVHKLTEAFRLRMQLPHLPDPSEAVQKLLELLTQQEARTVTRNNPDQEQSEKTEPGQSFPK